MQSGLLNSYECITALAETDFTEDLKQFDVPTLLLHGEDDQVVPMRSSSMKSARLIKGAKDVYYPGAPHGITARIRSTPSCSRSFGARRCRSSVKRWLLQPLSPAERGLTMKIVIIGGSGLIGSKVVALLREHGHEAVPASPDSGVNTLTGEGLAEGRDPLRGMAWQNRAPGRSRLTAPVHHDPARRGEHDGHAGPVALKGVA